MSQQARNIECFRELEETLSKTRPDVVGSLEKGAEAMTRLIKAEAKRTLQSTFVPAKQVSHSDLMQYMYIRQYFTNTR